MFRRFICKFAFKLKSPSFYQFILNRKFIFIATNSCTCRAIVKGNLYKLELKKFCCRPGNIDAKLTDKKCNLLRMKN